MVEWSGGTLPTSTTAPDSRRWFIFGMLGSAFLLFLMDATIVYVALPGIERELDLTIASVQWVMTAYLLCFGGFLLLGGRLSALVGPRRMFVLGLGLWTAASLACGLAQSVGVLVAGRAVQGVGAAMAAPAALPLLATNFQGGAGRRSALRAWAVVGALAGTAGLLIGGPLTDGPGWRWVFLLNVPVGSVLVLTSPPLLRTHARAPLVRLRAMYSRTRLGGVLVLFAVGVAVDGNSFLLTVYTQHVLHFSASGFGLMMTAMTLSAVAGSAVGQAAVLRPGLRTVALAGLALVETGSLRLTRVPTQGSVGYVVLTLSILGPGVGAAFVAGQIAVVSAAPETASLLLSGLTDASFSLGGGLGLVLLSVVLTRGAAANVSASAAATTLSLQAGFAVAAGVAALGFVAAFALLGRPRRSVYNQPFPVP
jgi:predicted MFS family arabinose efflux permease